ncbi:MAG: ABC transporter [Spirochaetes bacterium]|nr:MAG: ABC transporter [Spirochaetota bacterium]
MQNLKGIFTIWYRDVLRYSRDRARIVASLAQPLLFLFIFGSGLSPVMSNLGGGHLDFRQFMFPGILGMTVLFTSIFSAVSIVWDREFGFFKEVMAAPISRAAVALGKVAGGSTIALFQGCIILLLSPILNIQLTLFQIITLVGLMLLLAMVMTSLGILIASRQRSMEGFQMIMNFLLMPMFFLSGAFFPLKNIPLWMEILAKIDPVAYGVDPLRQVVLSKTVPSMVIEMLSNYSIAVNSLVMAGFATAFLIPAILLFGKRD